MKYYYLIEFMNNNYTEIANIVIIRGKGHYFYGPIGSVNDLPLSFQVLFSHKEPPLELMDTDAKVGENIGYVTFGKCIINAF